MLQSSKKILNTIAACCYIMSKLGITKTPSTTTQSKTAINTKISSTQSTTLQSESSDVISIILSDFGIWQLRTVFIIFLSKISAAWFMAVVIFTAPLLQPQTQFVCNKENINTNQTIKADQCWIMDNVSNASTASQEHYECRDFSYKSEFQSLVMQFNLVCARKVLIAWTQYWHLLGAFFGSTAASKLMLRFSPRTTYRSAILLQLVCGIATGYARDFNVHCAFRFLTAACCATLFTAGQEIFADIIGDTCRTTILILYDTFWSLGIMTLPSLSALFNHWSHIYLGITLPTFLLVLLLKWVPDSPRWLLRNGQISAVEQVELTIREAAFINDCTWSIPDNFREELLALQHSLKTQSKSINWLELWHGPRAKTHMFAAHMALAAFTITFMGMTLNIRTFGRVFLPTNMVALGLSEICGCFLALHLSRKHNKWKWQLAGGFNIFAGLIGCLGWTFTYVTIHPSVKVTLWMLITVIPKVAVSCAQALLFGCMAEMMPAHKQSIFTFSVMTWARFWLFPAPFINLLRQIDVALSLSTYCILGIFGGICICLLRTPRMLTTKQATTNITQAVQLHSNAKNEKKSALDAALWSATTDTDIYISHL